MNTAQLTSLARSCPITRIYFHGVYASDTLPSSASFGTYICNLDSSEKPGSHWVSFYVPRDPYKPVEYFDSYGLEAPPSMFELFLSRKGEVDYYVYNNRTVQHLQSAVCGQYSLYFIWQRPIRRSMDNVLSIFDSDCHLYNDILVNNEIEQHFQVDLDVFDGEYINQFCVPLVYC